ncbi:MAG TPA: hypothetical protein VI874_01010 [Candidatus Norongarragalinales archaeon]|nr:hypothetical protein [Candidatus Norongarragalinales archaeon]
MKTLFVFHAFLSFLSAFDAVPLGFVTAENDAFSSRLLDRMDNPYGFSESVPTFSDPLIHFSLSVSAVYPSINDAVLTNGNTRALFGSFINHSLELQSGDESYCGHSHGILRFQNRKVALTGQSRLDGVSRGRSVLSGVWTPPFSPDEWSKANALEVWLEGTMELDYLLTNRTVICSTSCTRFGCTTRKTVLETVNPKKFVYGTSSAVRYFRVLKPQNEALLFNPFFSKRSLRTPWLDAFYFSNNSLSAWEFQRDGKPLAAETYFRYSVVSDPLGVKSIRATPIFQSVQTLPYTLSSVASARYSDGRKLRVVENDSGVHQFTFRFMDFFGQVASQNATVETKDEAFLSLSLSKSSVLVGEPLVVKAHLYNGRGMGLSGMTLRFTHAGGQSNVSTGPDGFAVTSLNLQSGVQSVEAHFDGQSGWPEAYARRTVTVTEPFSSLDVPVRFEWFFVPFLLVLGILATRFR